MEPIPCSAQLPVSGVYVLAWNYWDGRWVIARYDTAPEEDHWYIRGQHSTNCVSHWLPLPKAPT